MYELSRYGRLLRSVPIALSLVLAIGNTSVAYSNHTTIRLEISQNKTQITGTVVDQNDEPLIGVNVLEKVLPMVLLQILTVNLH